MVQKELVYWHEGLSCVNDDWENAYNKFETQEEEIQKFIKRFKQLGAEKWDKNAEIASLFCGRGGGLIALERLGFKNLHGVDLSPELLMQYEGPAKLYVADCRDIKFEDNSLDYISIHGGLHHLVKFPEDLETTIKEIHRVLKKDGHFICVEPWMTPFLGFVHFACKQSIFKKIYPKLDALSTMVDLEYPIYDTWLAHPDKILSIYDKYFTTEYKNIEKGKINYSGVKRN